MCCSGTAGGRWSTTRGVDRFEEEALFIRLKAYLEPLLVAFGLADDLPFLQIELFPMESFATKRKDPIRTEDHELSCEVVA